MESREGRCDTPSVAPPKPLPSFHQLPGASLTMDCKGSHGIAEHLALKLAIFVPNTLKEQASIPSQQYQSTSLPTVHNQPTSARPVLQNRMTLGAGRWESKVPDTRGQKLTWSPMLIPVPVGSPWDCEYHPELRHFSPDSN